MTELSGQYRSDMTYRNGTKSGPMTQVFVRRFSVAGSYARDVHLIKISGSNNENGRLQGPYKEIRDDGFVLFEGTMSNGAANGTAFSISDLPSTYNVAAKASRFAFQGAEWTLSASELYDADFLVKDQYHTIKATIEDARAVWMTDTAADGTLLYEGTAMGVYRSDGHRLNPKRLKGRCYYNGHFEECEYLNDPDAKPKRIDPVGTERRNWIIQSANTRAARSDELRAEHRRAEAREKEIHERRIARDEENARRWAANAAASRRRAQEADAELFRRVYGGGALGSATVGFDSSNDINDPLNPNNPSTIAINRQVQRILAEHQGRQQQAEADYQSDLAERTRQIEAARSNQGAQQNQVAGTASSDWDCDRQWRADKCGDRHSVHEINLIGRANTGGGSADSSRSPSVQNVSASPTRAGEADQDRGVPAGASAAGNSDTQPAMGPERVEALAICRPKKSDPDLWWCDGPVQSLILADDTLSRQLGYVGCGGADPVNQRLALDDRHFVFFCKFGLQPEMDRDIAVLHNLPGHILVKRKNYQCRKHDISRCSTLALP